MSCALFLRMIDLLLLIMPMQYWALLIILAGFLIMLGFRRTGFRLFGGVILLAALSPAIEALLEILPAWLLILITVIGVISIFRMFSRPRRRRGLF